MRIRNSVSFIGGYCLLASAVLALSCSSSSSSAKKGGAALDTCLVASDCQSGICINYYPDPNSPLYGMAAYCSTRCEGGCPNNFTCGTAPDGSQACMDACLGPDHGYENEYGCRNDVPIACAVADETYCEDCGCDGELRCEPGVGCQEKRDVGGACKRDSDCKSNNCSTYLGVCRVPVWSSCTADNCDICTTDSLNNSVFCTRDCGTDSECNGGYCLGYGYEGSYWCHRPCSACTNDTCDYTTSSYNSVISYCDCTSCSSTSAPRPLGIECGSDSSCQSASCYAMYGVDEDNLGYEYQVAQLSLCTQTCTSDADCSAAGLVCAQLPCFGGDSSYCGALCMHPCDADGTCRTYGGTCREFPNPGAGSVKICDLRHEDGGYCSANEQCASGRCTNKSCVNAAGVANGSGCTQPADCQSANCVNGVCKGTAMLGDSCAVSADCSVGTCCTSSSKCATSC